MLENATFTNRGSNQLRRAELNLKRRKKQLALDKARLGTLRDPIQRRALEVKIQVAEDYIRRDDAAITAAVKRYEEATHE